jgi:DinB superfamily
MPSDKPLRKLLIRLLDWEAAHVGLDKAVAGMPAALRGMRPPGLPHSAWELLEHIRLAQHDILEFCRNPDYEEQEWPKDFWPASVAPPSDAAWRKSLRDLRKDRDALKKLAGDPKSDLDARIPRGGGATLLVELVLTADHTSYHVGQLVLVRRLLGDWKS